MGDMLTFHSMYVSSWLEIFYLPPSCLAVSVSYMYVFVGLCRAICMCLWVCACIHPLCECNSEIMLLATLYMSTMPN